MKTDPRGSSSRVRSAIWAGCGLVLLGAAVLLLHSIWSDREPSFQGRKLTEWADDLRFPEGEGQKDSRRPDVREKHERAVNAIRQMGDQALVPALKLLQKTDGAFDETLRRWSARLHGWERFSISLPHPPYADESWRRGGDILDALGPQAASAIPALTNFLQRGDEPAAGNATGAFRSIGPQCIPSLMAVLTDGSKKARGLAAFSLAHFGAQSAAAIPVLLRYLNDDDGQLRHNAAYALVEISNDPSIVVPAMTNYLANEENEIPPQVFLALGHFGTSAGAAVPSLQKLVDPGRRLHRYALQALGALSRIDPEACRISAAKWKAAHTNYPPSDVLDRFLSGGSGDVQGATNPRISAETNAPARRR